MGSFDHGVDGSSSGCICQSRCRQQRTEEVAELIAFGDEEDADVKEFITKADTDKDGRISLPELQAFFEEKQTAMDAGAFSEFLDEFSNKAQAAASSACNRRVRKIFALVDADKSGALDPVEISNFISMGEEDKESKDFLEACDKDADGKVDLKEVLSYFKDKLKSSKPVDFAQYLNECEARAKAAGRYV